MKIVTWNINGIKARLNNLVTWLSQNRPDIVCLQEIKSTNENFPYGPIEDLGYYAEVHGQKTFNGVALLSRTKPEETNRYLPGDNEDRQARFIEGIYTAGSRILRVVSLYVPNGNPVESSKYSYKLSWMNRLHDFAKNRLLLEEPFILAGDYNVIAMDSDAKKPEDWLNDALFLPSTREKFRSLVNLGFTDASCITNSSPEYTYWGYQAGAWPRNNGIRIDRFLLSPEATDKLTGAFTQKEVRNQKKSSDHVPIWIELDI